MKRKKLTRNVLRAMDAHNAIGSILIELAGGKTQQEIYERANEICVKIDELIQLLKKEENGGTQVKRV